MLLQRFSVILLYNLKIYTFLFMKTKLLKNVFSSAIITGFIAFSVSCTVKQENDVCRVAALNDSIWKCSSWISVSDAPVVTGKVIDGTRSADGASWFVTTVTNSKDVRQALWMTTGLGVYYICKRHTGW